MIRKHYDKILLGLALVVLLITFAFSFLGPEPKPITEFVDNPRLTPENTFTPSPPPEVEVAVAAWENPQPQSAGPQWIFDIFTPPVIYYNAVANEFDLRHTIDVPKEPDFGVQLVDVREELYRIQIAGHGGGRGDAGFFVNLENVETGDFVFAKETKDYPTLEAELRSFRLERVPVPHAGSTNVTTEVAFVVIYDKRLETEVELRSDQTLKEDEPTAIFIPTLTEGAEIGAKVGESFNVGEFTYQVEAIEAPTATVVKINRADPTERETKTLAVLRPEAQQRATGQTPSQGSTSTPGSGQPTTGQRQTQPPPPPPSTSGDGSGTQFAF